jgi:hypothetical protein
MRKIILPAKDASIYEAFPDRNSGLDEILEVGHLAHATSPAGSAARAMVAFDTSEYNNITASVSYFLNLKVAFAKDIVRGQQLLFVPIAAPWSEGSGYFFETNKQRNDGATWLSASRTSAWSLAGGDILSIPSASITLSSFPMEDVRVNITPLVHSASIEHGIMIKFPLIDEADTTNTGIIKFFSAQTHTIHAPYIEGVWSSQNFITGSLRPIPNLNVKISVVGAAETYRRGDIVRLQLPVRDEFPSKAFDATPRYGNRYYLPQSSYFSVIDDQTKEEVIRGDEFSPIECDMTGSYLVLDTSPLYTGRYYRLRLHVAHGATRKTIDPNILFRITQ